MFSIILDIYPEVGPYGSSIFNLGGTTILVSIVVAPFYSPANNAQGLQLHHIPVNTYFGFFLNTSHPNRCD